MLASCCVFSFNMSFQIHALNITAFTLSKRLNYKIVQAKPNPQWILERFWIVAQFLSLMV